MSDKDLYLGSEEGPFEVRCQQCGELFRAPTSFATACLKCRRPMLSALRRQTTPYRPVYLDCEGLPSCGGAVLHKFHSRVEHKVGKRRSDRLLYQCSRCGHLRVFGDEEK